MKTLLEIFILFLLTFFAKELRTQCQSEICTWPKVYLASGNLNCTDWEVSLYDDFSGIELNNEIWKTHRFVDTHEVARLNSWDEEQLYMDENVTIDNGKCILKGKFEPGTTWTNHQGQTFTRDVTSGMIETREIFRFAYYEAKIKNPGGGWWPAFWMWHHDEIDIMEIFHDKSLFFYNLHTTEDELGCLNEFHFNVSDGNFYTFAAELTPFSLTFYLDGTPLPKRFYRFYDKNGQPLKVSCDNTEIPSGNYYVNPVFPQSRSRGFSPIINLAVLPKYGLGSCQTQNPNCLPPLCYDCSGQTTCDWGSPFGDNCTLVHDFPGILEIDFVKIKEREYKICNSLMVYGYNCQKTGIHRDPISCSNFYCLGETANLYLEDISGSNWLSEVEILYVLPSLDIEVLTFDNHRIQYKQNHIGEGRISIVYLSNCGSNTVFNYFLPSIEINAELKTITPCEGKATIEFEGISCATSQLDIISIKSKNKWGSLKPVVFEFEANKLHLNFKGQYFIRKLLVQVVDRCHNNYVFEFNIPPCNECCPENFEYDGVNCFSGFNFSDVNGFVHGNSFFTTTNCMKYPDNNCCPPGTTFNGIHCFFIEIEVGFEGFVYGNGFYTNINCEKNCCPESYTFDGANCHSGINFDAEVVNGFIYDGIFYTSPNCNYYINTNCCPPESIFDGYNCNFGSIPIGFEGFVFGNGFYVKPNCEKCCPDGANFDGANCYYGIHFIEGEGFIHNNSFYTKPDCINHTEYDCCPPGSVFDGANCYYEIHFIEGEGFIHNNSFYTKPKDCFELFNQNISDPINEETVVNKINYNDKQILLNENSIKIFPNPFTDALNIEITNLLYQDIEKVIVMTIDGTKITSIKGDSINRIMTLNEINNPGVYIIQIFTNYDIFIFKVIKI
ncbi:MAG: glycosyl hydrolase family protein [Saprospirales bacterium]|nr:MAG: glycosyl hydrolase family protein [Saprospirales bacterium]